ncbi:nucleolar protein 11-like [Liolophura sinensis]|uniref:nucleolar protein 11-like n=1 Tax=Liolophura sinensis TaxID=3198878 RepID=UPI0031584CB1
MATIENAFALCPIFSDENKIYVTPSEERGCATVTHKGRCVDILKIEDQKIVQSWSMRHGMIITAPVVYSQTECKYIAVQNKEELRLWARDQHNLEKAKKKSVPHPIHRVFSLPNLEPIVLFENGQIEVLSAVKQITDTKSYTDGAEIIWCEAVRWQDSPVVVIVSRSQDNRLKAHICKHKKDRWENTSVELPVKGEEISCCCMPISQTVQIYTLCGSGALYCVSDVTQSAVQVLTLPVGDSSAMVTAGESHIAVTGVKQDGKVGLGIFDVKFGSLLAWKPYPEENFRVKKLYVAEQHLFVVCGKALYAYRFSCGACTLASALGSFTSAETGSKEDDSEKLSLSWKVGNPQVTEKSCADVLSLFEKVNNSSKTSTIEDFRDMFNLLMEVLQKPDYQQFWTSPYMSELIRRLATEKKFWPKEEILQIINQGFVPPSVMADFFEALIQHSDLTLLHAATSHLHDIPEAQLVKTLNFYMSCADGEFAEVCDKPETMEEPAADDDGHTRTVKCPFSFAKTQFINAVVALPYNDVFLLECLQNFKFENVLILMQYLHYCFTSNNPDEDIKGCAPSLLQVVDWMCLLVDAHATQLILSPDARPVLVDLHQLVHEQLEFYDELISLEAVLSQLKKNCAPFKERNVGLYCIEVLHIA